MNNIVQIWPYYIYMVYYSSFFILKIPTLNEFMLKRTIGCTEGSSPCMLLSKMYPFVFASLTLLHFVIDRYVTNFLFASFRLLFDHINFNQYIYTLSETRGSCSHTCCRLVVTIQEMLCTPIPPSPSHPLTSSCHSRTPNICPTADGR